MNTWRIASITVVVVFALAVINWLRGGNDGFALSNVLPFLGGDEPSLLYDGGAVVMCAIAALGIGRLLRRPRKLNGADDGWEDVYEDEEETDTEEREEQ